mgnify:CR=1 FL=1
MFEEQILTLAAEAETEPSLDENGMEPFEDIMASVFWDLLLSKEILMESQRLFMTKRGQE